MWAHLPFKLERTAGALTVSPTGSMSADATAELVTPARCWILARL